MEDSGWIVMALIAAAAWIWQNVRSQLPPKPAVGAATDRPRANQRRRPQPPPVEPRPNKKTRRAENPERTQRLIDAPMTPMPNADAPRPSAVAEVASAPTPAPTPRRSTSTVREVAKLLEQPENVAAAFVLREILDEPLCKRGRHRR